MPKVNPDIIHWARETAGLTLEEAATKLNLHQARGVSAVDRLTALESGDDQPTRSLLTTVDLLHVSPSPKRRPWPGFPDTSGGLLRR
jgi:transcriptional regulator with XRE-family HTH domain